MRAKDIREAVKSKGRFMRLTKAQIFANLERLVNARLKKKEAQAWRLCAKAHDDIEYLHLLERDIQSARAELLPMMEFYKGQNGQLPPEWQRVYDYQTGRK